MMMSFQNTIRGHCRGLSLFNVHNLVLFSAPHGGWLYDGAVGGPI